MTVQVLIGDCREVLAGLPAESVQCVVTSPPYYGLRDYGADGQIGLEQRPDCLGWATGSPCGTCYVSAMVAVFREVRRVLRPDATVWLNLGDSYAGSTMGGGNGANSTLVGTHHSVRTGTKSVSKRGLTGLKPKDLMLIPARVALALQADGWWLRSAITWCKLNPMPESTKDRPTSATEMVYLFTKSPTYFYDSAAIAEPAEMKPQRRLTPQAQRDGGHAVDAWKEPRVLRTEPAQDGSGTRNARNWWTFASEPFPGSHFATMPPTLAERCIKAGSRPGDMVLDPFGGAGTTGLVADRLGRHATLIELNPEYADMARRRIAGDAPLFAEVA